VFKGVEKSPLLSLLITVSDNNFFSIRQMTYLKLSEAARQVGVSRPTIYKYAAEGRISVTKDRLGHKQVQLSELLRVFGELSPETQKTSLSENTSASFASMRQSPKTAETGNVSALLVELERAKAQLQSKVMEADLLRERVDELKARERYSQEERSRLMAMLEQSQRLLAAPAPKPRAPVRKKAAAPAPVASVPALAPAAPSRAPARRKVAVAAPVPAVPAKAGAAKKSPISKSKR
jgi:excisionase family DNA binding protein